MLSRKCSCAMASASGHHCVNDQLIMSDSEGDELSDINSNGGNSDLETEVNSSDELRRSMIFPLRNLYNHGSEFSHQKMLTMLDMRTEEIGPKINKSSMCCGHIILRPVKLVLFFFLLRIISIEELHDRVLSSFLIGFT